MTTQTQNTQAEQTETNDKASWYSNRYVKWGLGIGGVAAVGAAAYFAVRYFSGDKEPIQVIGEVIDQAAEAVKTGE